MNDKPLKLDCAAWLSDPDLRACSATERGVLIDIMAICHSGQPYGFLNNGGRRVSDKRVARFCGMTEPEFARVKKSLLAENRIVENQDGEVFVPRMVKDGLKQKPRTKPKIAEPEGEMTTPRFCQAWDSWRKHRSELKKPLTRLASERQLAMLAMKGPEEGARWVEYAIERGWQGLYEPPEKKDANAADIFKEYTKQAKILTDREEIQRLAYKVRDNLGRKWYQKFVDLVENNSTVTGDQREWN